MFIVKRALTVIIIYFSSCFMNVSDFSIDRMHTTQARTKQQAQQVMAQIATYQSAGY